MNNLREQANRVRQLPLTDVAGHLGGTQDSQDKQRWDFTNCAVWIGKGENGNRFYDHRTCHGGGGAIDFAMYVLSCDFKEAVRRLCDQASGSSMPPSKALGMHRTSTTDLVTFSLPHACPQHQALVFDYLTNTRRLPAHVVEPVLATGDVYADSRRNAVFVCRAPDGLVSGAELRGTGKTPYKGMAKGSRRGVGFFTLAHPNPTELVVVESALDALAYQALHRSSATIVSTAGVMPACPVLLVLAHKLGVTDIVIAYDSDGAGDGAAERLMASMQGEGLTLRRRAPSCKDWNDILLHIGEEATHPEVPGDGGCRQPSLFAEVA